MAKDDVIATKWQDWTSFALGLWLAVSPWALDYTRIDSATANAAFAGLVLALASHFEAALDELQAEWLNMGLGLWLVLAPFLLGFGSEAVPTINSIAVGTAAAALASSALSLQKSIRRVLLR